LVWSFWSQEEVKMGLWSARSALQQVEEEKGRAAVLECKLAKTNRPKGCAKDIDCKGNRICEAGTCV
jgi:hypothetical protein